MRSPSPPSATRQPPRVILGGSQRHRCIKAPAIITIYDDGYGISVPNQFQMVQRKYRRHSKRLFNATHAPEEKMYAWLRSLLRARLDYPALVETYQTAAEIAREYHIPALVHITDVTQPPVTSASGSHERYKSSERLSGKRNLTGG